MIIPTLIINRAGQWLGQGGFSTTGQTNIECDICPGLMSRILCFCNRIHIVHIEKQAGVNIGKQLLADTFPPFCPQCGLHVLLNKSIGKCIIGKYPIKATQKPIEHIFLFYCVWGVLIEMAC